MTRFLVIPVCFYVTYLWKRKSYFSIKTLVTYAENLEVDVKLQDLIKENFFKVLRTNALLQEP